MKKSMKLKLKEWFLVPGACSRCRCFRLRRLVDLCCRMCASIWDRPDLDEGDAHLRSEAITPLDLPPSLKKGKAT